MIIIAAKFQILYENEFKVTSFWNPNLDKNTLIYRKLILNANLVTATLLSYY